MIRELFKNMKPSDRIDRVLKRYNVREDLLGINRKSVSRALMIGLFFSLIPMPLQTLAVVASLLLIRFNILIALTMVWLTNPVTMPFVYYIEYLTGNMLLMEGEPVEVELSLAWFQENFRTIIIPLYLGALFYAVIVALSVYYLAQFCWIRSVKRQKRSRIALRDITQHTKKRLV